LSLSIRCPHQNQLFTSPVSHTCHMPSPSHCSSVDRTNNIWLGVQRISPQHHILEHPQPTFRPSLLETKFQSHTKHKTKL
jgi:hypothetical protein